MLIRTYWMAGRVVALGLVIAAAAANAQSGLFGAVTNTQDVPIANATVRVLDSASRKTVATAQTDATGRFSLEDLPKGNYDIAVAARGFASQMASYNLIDPNTPRMRAFHLGPRDCEAPGMQCESHGAPAHDVHPVVARRDVTMEAGSALDLRTGRAVPPGAPQAGVQLVAEGGAVKLVALHGGKFGRPSAGRCQSGLNDLSWFRLDGVDAAMEVCIVGPDLWSSLLFTSDVPVGARQVEIHLVTRR